MHVFRKWHECNSLSDFTISVQPVQKHNAPINCQPVSSCIYMYISALVFRCRTAMPAQGPIVIYLYIFSSTWHQPMSLPRLRDWPSCPSSKRASWSPAKGGSGIVIARLADGSNVFYLICFLTDLFLIDSFEWFGRFHGFEVIDVWQLP